MWGDTIRFATTELVATYRNRRDWTTGLTTPEQRARYRLTIRNGLLYTANGQLFDTRGAPAIFVMDSEGNLYATTRQAAGIFNHASFFDGGPVAGAGEMIVRNGEIRDINSRSGHYLPSGEIHYQVIKHLDTRNVVPYRIRGITCIDGLSSIALQ